MGPAAPSTKRCAESENHRRLKRGALLWAEAQGYSACALEVRLPKCRYRADVVAYRAKPDAATAIFECKHALPDLRRDNCCSAEARERLGTVQRRRLILEKHLRTHYPSLRVADSLFAEFDSHNFVAIGHRNYGRVLRELKALQNRLYDCTKFETLFRYRCANLLFLVLTRELFSEAEIPIGWGALVEADGVLSLARKPTWLQTTSDDRLHFLERIAAAGTGAVNRQLQITFADIVGAHGSRCS